MKTRNFKEININVKKKADVYATLSEPLKEASVFDSGVGRTVEMAFSSRESAVYVNMKPKKAIRFAKAIMKIAKRVQKG